MAGGKRGAMIYRIFAFLLIASLGVVPVSIAHNDGVDIHIEIVEPDGLIRFGDEVVLRCDISGLAESSIVQWQYMDPDERITRWRVLDCTDRTYKYVLTRENVNYYYRVIVGGSK